MVSTQVDDINKIFRDFEIITLEKDQAHRVFLKALKQENYVPVDLSNVALYSIMLGRRTIDFPNIYDAHSLDGLRLDC